MGITLNLERERYADGDIPRYTYDSLTGPGWAYYSACIAGRCAGCNIPTNQWYVTIKSQGKYWCMSCDEKGKKEQKEMTSYYDAHH